MLLWDAVQRRERNSVRQWTTPPLLLGAGKGATTSLHISPKGAWIRQLCRDMARIINIISLCCYRWTNIALVGVQRHCSLQPKPAARRLLQPTAVLSAQIITKDRPPSKQAFQITPHFLCFPEKLFQQWDLQAIPKASSGQGVLLKPNHKDRELRITNLCPIQNKKQEATKVSPVPHLSFPFSVTATLRSASKI